MTDYKAAIERVADYYTEHGALPYDHPEFEGIMVRVWPDFLSSHRELWFSGIYREHVIVTSRPYHPHPVHLEAERSWVRDLCQSLRL